MSAAQSKHAASTSGRYGAKLFEPHDPLANALLASLETELPDVAYFTRDDLLYLSAFDHVATITRYTYVRNAVSLLIRRGKLVEVSRTQLCLASRAKNVANDNLTSFEKYLPAVRRAALKMGDHTFGVMDIVHEWKNDPHLTTNAKRVAARQGLTRLVHDRVVEKVDSFDYRLVPA